MGGDFQFEDASCVRVGKRTTLGKLIMRDGSTNRAVVLGSCTFTFSRTVMFDSRRLAARIPRTSTYILSSVSTYFVGEWVVPIGTMLDRLSTSRIVDSVTGR